MRVVWTSTSQRASSRGKSSAPKLACSLEGRGSTLPRPSSFLAEKRGARPWPLTLHSKPTGQASHERPRGSYGVGIRTRAGAPEKVDGSPVVPRRSSYHPEGEDTGTNAVKARITAAFRVRTDRLPSSGWVTGVPNARIQSFAAPRLRCTGLRHRPFHSVSSTWNLCHHVLLRGPHR